MQVTGDWAGEALERNRYLQTLKQLDKTLSNVAECQSKHYNQNQMVDGQRRSECNQERGTHDIVNLLENLSLSEALIKEKVEAEVARRLVKNQEGKDQGN